MIPAVITTDRRMRYYRAIARRHENRKPGYAERVFLGAALLVLWRSGEFPRLRTC